MSTTVQNLIDYAQTFIQYSPLSVGTGNQPALGIANELQMTITNPPFTWPWNRGESTALTMTAGTGDYTVSITDFGYLERITLKDPDTNETYEIRDIYNNLSRGVASAVTTKRARPNACAVHTVTYGTSVKLRFMGIPDKAYTTNITYQKLVTPLTTLTSTTGTLVIPDQMIDVFQNLFTGEAMLNVDDTKGVQFIQRGLAALISKAEGLTELQINAFLEQYWARLGQQSYRGAMVQQAGQARGAQ